MFRVISVIFPMHGSRGLTAAALACVITHKGQCMFARGDPTARIGLIANSSLRVEPYTTPYVIVPHQ